MEYRNVEHLIQRLSIEKKTEATRKLTEFYAKARFRIPPAQIRQQCTDRSYDGGIDFYHHEDSTYFVLQSKFASSPRRVSTSEVLVELIKLKNTLSQENPNRSADDFVTSFKKDVSQKTAILEILWLTTNTVPQSVRGEIQHDLDQWRTRNGWSLEIDFMAVDKDALDNVIYDVKHGYVPYTGKKVLKLEEHQWMEILWEDTNVRSVVCTVEVNELLKWFRSLERVGDFLQKNVRDFLGENKSINRAIAKSYLDSPDWFWYKHNGIVVFADNLSIHKENKEKLELVLRNPQVVNGGQTLSALYPVYHKQDHLDNPAKVLVRIYRLPYEDTKTYQRSIEIIKALNSQNAIKASDLHSTDPCQVRLEQLLAKVGEDGYAYIRKRSSDRRARKYQISMHDLALPYYVCKKNVPHEGVRGNVEELFDEQDKYDEVFNEAAINRDLNASHVALKFVTVWMIKQLLDHIELPKRDSEYWTYSEWFVLADVYQKLSDWKQSHFPLSWQDWVVFIDSDYFEKAVTKYSQTMFKAAREMIPQREDAHAFFRKAETVAKFAGRARIREFNSLMNKACGRFKRDVACSQPITR